MFSNLVRTVSCTFLTSTFIVGLIGNLLVCLAVYKTMSMRTPTNLILVNLAVADMLGCVVNMPIMFVTFITDFEHSSVEVLGEIHFVLTVVIGIAICACHVLLCIDRYDAVKSPFHKRITRQRMKQISKWLWCLSVVAGIVTSILVVMVPTHWLTLQDDQPHYIAGEILNGFATLVILSILASMLYSCIVVKQGIKKHNQQMEQSLGRGTLDKEIRITTVATVLVTAFTITCLPWILVRLVYSITGHQDKVSYIISYTLLYTSHAINPIVYAGFMKHFQRAMMQVLSGLMSTICCGRNICCSRVCPEDGSTGNVCSGQSIVKKPTGHNTGHNSTKDISPSNNNDLATVTTT